MKDEWLLIFIAPNIGVDALTRKGGRIGISLPYFTTILWLVIIKWTSKAEEKKEKIREKNEKN